MIALKVTDLGAVAADREVELVTPNFERRILRVDDDGVISAHCYRSVQATVLTTERHPSPPDRR